MILARRVSWFIRIMAAALLCMACAAKAGAAELTVYPPLPDNQYRSELYEVAISQDSREQSSAVYKSTREADNPYNKHGVFSTDTNHWTSFSFSGAVTVRVKLRDGSAIKTATVHPLARQIRADVTGNTASFTLTQPANLYVQVDSKPRDPLFIFANPPESDVPTAKTPNVVYFGPGVTDLGKDPLKIGDGQTAYLAGGAYVKGRLVTAGPNADKPITIRGRGILSGIDLKEKRGTWGQHMIDAMGRTAPPQINVEGIIITDSPSCGVMASRRLTAENVKILAWSRCSDGIGGGAGSLIEDCFLKVNDDSIHFYRSGLKVLNNVVWIQAAGSALQMGWNVKESMEGAHADGLDIIGDDPGLTHTTSDSLNSCVVALMDMHNRATYKNVVIENIRHDGKPYQLFGVRTMLDAHVSASLASYREGRGNVDGMLFKNITAAQKPLQPSVFDGNGSEPGSIENITFDNLRIADELVTEKNAADYISQRGKTAGFRYVSR